MSVWIRTLWHVLKARWRTWRFKMPVLHFVPMDHGPGDGRMRSIHERPTLCGAKIDPIKVDGTIQANIVGCWSCATAIENDRDRWEPRRYQVLKTENGTTWCITCGSVLVSAGEPAFQKCRCTRRAK